MFFPTSIANRRLQGIFLSVCFLCGITVAIGTPAGGTRAQQPLPALDGIHFIAAEQNPVPAKARTSIISDFLEALDVLQEEYFAVWQGIWPGSIDWTSAVIGTYLSSALTTLSASYSSLGSDMENENLINRYFSQLVGAYFSQDIFSLMQEANDDMLWVVLQWLESIKFINTHSAQHYMNPSSSDQRNWHGSQYIPAFAHRARIFWDLASKGWNTTLCDGGMIWSPYVLPYKNAITNELYITASISMYLYFPGDDNASPFGLSHSSPFNDGSPGKPHDQKYLAAATEAYKWLKGINMTNNNGLYVDGFHISGWSGGNNTAKRCDQRNEMVYTYNQGVLLSGVRGLYEATGSRSYLEDGHKLVEDVIRATGWHSLQNDALDQGSKGLGKWHGLGRSGILEDACDAFGSCFQDGQTFKGIFFSPSRALLCSFATTPDTPEGQVLRKDLDRDRKWHDASCSNYSAWIQHNSRAAITTRDKEGKFGMWWGAPQNVDTDDFHPHVDLPDRAIDYRNLGVPSQWENSRRYELSEEEPNKYPHSQDGEWRTLDLNNRGRGRTVETQGGGVSVLKAAWELT